MDINAHMDKNQFGCSHCSARFERQMFFHYHTCERSKMTIQCDCGEVSANRKAFLDHFITNHASFVKGNLCKMCDIQVEKGGRTAHWNLHGKWYFPRSPRRMLNASDLQRGATAAATPAADSAAAAPSSLYARTVQNKSPAGLDENQNGATAGRKRTMQEEPSSGPNKKTPRTATIKPFAHSASIRAIVQNDEINFSPRASFTPLLNKGTPETRSSLSSRAKRTRVRVKQEVMDEDEATGNQPTLPAGASHPASTPPIPATPTVPFHYTPSAEALATLPRDVLQDWDIRTPVEPAPPTHDPNPPDVIPGCPVVGEASQGGREADDSTPAASAASSLPTHPASSTHSLCTAVPPDPAKDPATRAAPPTTSDLPSRLIPLGTIRSGKIAPPIMPRSPLRFKVKREPRDEAPAPQAPGSVPIAGRTRGTRAATPPSTPALAVKPEPASRAGPVAPKSAALLQTPSLNVKQEVVEQAQPALPFDENTLAGLLVDFLTTYPTILQQAASAAESTEAGAAAAADAVEPPPAADSTEEDVPSTSSGTRLADNSDDREATPSGATPGASPTPPPNPASQNPPTSPTATPVLRPVKQEPADEETRRPEERPLEDAIMPIDENSLTAQLTNFLQKNPHLLQSAVSAAGAAESSEATNAVDGGAAAAEASGAAAAEITDYAADADEVSTAVGDEETTQPADHHDESIDNGSDAAFDDGVTEMLLNAAQANGDGSESVSEIPRRLIFGVRSREKDDDDRKPVQPESVASIADDSAANSEQPRLLRSATKETVQKEVDGQPVQSTPAANTVKEPVDKSTRRLLIRTMAVTDGESAERGAQMDKHLKAGYERAQLMRDAKDKMKADNYKKSMVARRGQTRFHLQPVIAKSEQKRRLKSANESDGELQTRDPHMTLSAVTPETRNQSHSAANNKEEQKTDKQPVRPAQPLQLRLAAAQVTQSEPRRRQRRSTVEKKEEKDGDYGEPSDRRAVFTRAVMSELRPRRIKSEEREDEEGQDEDFWGGKTEASECPRCKAKVEGKEARKAHYKKFHYDVFFLHTAKMNDVERWVSCRVGAAETGHSRDIRVCLHCKREVQQFNGRIPLLKHIKQDHRELFLELKTSYRLYARTRRPEDLMVNRMLN